jgi:hypothetical protein
VARAKANVLRPVRSSCFWLFRVGILRLLIIFIGLVWFGLVFGVGGFASLFIFFYYSVGVNALRGER